jgi:hypothetical protein
MFTIAGGIVLAILFFAVLPYLLPLFLGLLGIAVTAAIAGAVYLALPAPFGTIGAIAVMIAAIWITHRLFSSPQAAFISNEHIVARQEALRRVGQHPPRY